MDLDSTLIQNIITGVIAAIIGGIFGASGLLFFPFKRYMEKRLEKAETEALDRVKYQKDLYIVTAEEKSATNKYLFWLKEAVSTMLSDCECSKERGVYFKTHLEEVSDELVSKEAKRREIERSQLANLTMDK